jgi:two-component system phosphate regulon sensor histidine kinase PhoR
LPLICADRDRAVQILLNILDNAVKFTPEGGRVSITASPDRQDFMIIKVSDTGPGIPKSELPRLGERFYRVDKTRSRDLGGTGLGLSIVKHLMKAHSGEMQIDSLPGRGAEVSLKFPIFKPRRLDEGVK